MSKVVRSGGPSYDSKSTNKIPRKYHLATESEHILAPSSPRVIIASSTSWSGSSSTKTARWVGSIGGPLSRALLSFQFSFPIVPAFQQMGAPLTTNILPLTKEAEGLRKTRLLMMPQSVSACCGFRSRPKRATRDQKSSELENILLGDAVELRPSGFTAHSAIGVQGLCDVCKSGIHHFQEDGSQCQDTQQQTLHNAFQAR
ncbi:uncharacterized protein PHALS_10257 [Plasmopara halstedii]|uniref:Uncharacterized protein n=1 Tax=Plasmopara halstedii TaxID=4781 RepID=A0A0N7L4Z3_PLAHL|nr:uncharacterized protein PHALS_10257 [Plasmopara halstedii]CEG40035.1 hypothetical protein PHALS_10257 [Plasmopara halstedii]|eukprot:XP_024576404.1 hypothetical protein PHALS_10257 [Plasmopara halstedii]